MSRIPSDNGDDYPDAALKHLVDAKSLLASGRHDGAAYLSGYVVECALKSILRLENKPVWGHRLGDLRLAVIRDELKPEWILIDARTGISEPAGHLLSGIAHLHVLLGSTNEQSWQGLNIALDRLGRNRLLKGLPQSEVLLVHAMVPPGESGRTAEDAFTARAETEFEVRYYDDPHDEDDIEDRFWTLGDKESEDSPHHPLVVGYDMRMADFRDITEIAEPLSMGAYAAIDDRIANLFRTPDEEEK